VGRKKNLPSLSKLLRRRPVPLLLRRTGREDDATSANAAKTESVDGYLNDSVEHPEPKQEQEQDDTDTDTRTEAQKRTDKLFFPESTTTFGRIDINNDRDWANNLKTMRVTGKRKGHPTPTGTPGGAGAEAESSSITTAPLSFFPTAMPASMSGSNPNSPFAFPKRPPAASATTSRSGTGSQNNESVFAAPAAVAPVTFSASPFPQLAASTSNSSAQHSSSTPSTPDIAPTAIPIPKQPTLPMSLFSSGSFLST
jgi:hypothetical protein